MIARISRGYTTLQNADLYEALLKKEAFVQIANREFEGLKDIRVLRQTVGTEVEFIIIIYFESLAAIVDYACSFCQDPIASDDAKKLLKRFDTIPRHYTVAQ